jgi:hypothetical protein
MQLVFLPTLAFIMLYFCEPPSSDCSYIFKTPKVISNKTWLVNVLGWREDAAFVLTRMYWTSWQSKWWVQADQKIQKVDKSIAQSWPNVSSNADSQKKVSKKAS